MGSPSQASGQRIFLSLVSCKTSTGRPTKVSGLEAVLMEAALKSLVVENATKVCSALDDLGAWVVKLMVTSATKDGGIKPSSSKVMPLKRKLASSMSNCSQLKLTSRSSKSSMLEICPKLTTTAYTRSAQSWPVRLSLN